MRNIINQVKNTSFVLFRQIGISFFFLIFLLACPRVSPGTVGPIAYNIQDPDSIYFSDDQMVEVSARYPKPISKVAENVEIINAEEIAALNSHTISELLNRVAGVFVSSNGQDFGSSSGILIQGSTDLHMHHTLVLLDGIRLNYISSGNSDTNGIPLNIIKRIEIIKGPASSAWGSALGGVVNIITKDTGYSYKPKGTFSTSYGERRSMESFADISGKIKKIGYYFYVGKQDSDGLREDRFFHNKNAYAKLNLKINNSNNFQITAISTQPEFKYFDYWKMDLSATGDVQDRFITTTFNSEIKPGLNLSLSGNIFSRKYAQRFHVLGAGLYGSAGDLFRNFLWIEEVKGLNGRLVWEKSKHIASLGFEYSSSTLDQVIDNGPLMRSFGMPVQSVADQGVEGKWGVYLNDTISFGDLTLTPGLRYDSHSITQGFISPSLGATYKMSHDSLVRGSIAQGYSSPFLSIISGGGGVFNSINSDLLPEKIWSYQAGFETKAVDYFRLKTSLFLHQLDDRWIRDLSGSPANAGKNRRIGYEVELNTVPVKNISLMVNLSSLREKVYDINTSDNLHAANIRFKYSKLDNFDVNILGHYEWWQERETNKGRYYNLNWDLTVNKAFTLKSNKVELFLSLHNIFNTSQYWGEQVINPNRWVDSGLRFSF